MLSVGSLDTEETAEKEEVDLQLDVNVRELVLETKDLTDETIGTAKGGVNAGTNT